MEILVVGYTLRDKPQMLLGGLGGENYGVSRRCCWVAWVGKTTG
jgi:hypothetical protein